MTGKQRAVLRSMANTYQPVVYIGKEGITKNIIQEAWDALEARELIKCAVMKNAPMTAREACDYLCEKTHAQPIQCIGNKFVIYRPAQKPVIVVE